MRVAIVAQRATPTNRALATACWDGRRIELLSPRQALLALGREDVALARLDVREDLEGIEDGLSALQRLSDAGVRVLNPPSGLLRAHDKLLTARTLRAAGLPHPRTKLVEAGAEPPDVDFPVVLKPRFGSWARDVTLCADRGELRRTLDRLAHRPWFRATGAVVQELIPPLGYDLRLIVASGIVVGAGRRTAVPGEWRTNVALGATVAAVAPPPLAVNLALAAAAASGLDLVGVDLLPTGPGGFCVLELNGAVDFRPVYSTAPSGIYAEVVAALAGSRPDALEHESLAAARG